MSYLPPTYLLPSFSHPVLHPSCLLIATYPHAAYRLHHYLPSKAFSISCLPPMHTTSASKQPPNYLFPTSFMYSLSPAYLRPAILSQTCLLAMPTFPTFQIPPTYLLPA